MFSLFWVFFPVVFPLIPGLDKNKKEDRMRKQGEYGVSFAVRGKEKRKRKRKRNTNRVRKEENKGAPTHRKPNPVRELGKVRVGKHRGVAEELVADIRFWRV